ncbi:hypothetical protein LCGC14_3160460 [marine sediment metagenome]|uniref:Holliday junction resolvase RuvC n=1 Tax=marine sediment metagenome TaxID=412755 RepID=A0A0F8VRE8_9ZZZZ
MKILALDPATVTGFAYSNGASGTWDLSVRKDESSGMRLIRFEAKVREIIDTVGVDVIAFETPTVGKGKKANFDALKLQTKMQAVVELVAEQTEGVEYIGYHLSTIKKFALPNAKTRDKAAMLAAAKKKWPDVDIIDDNQADAMFLLALAQYELGG